MVNLLKKMQKMEENAKNGSQVNLIKGESF